MEAEKNAVKAFPLQYLFLSLFAKCVTIPVSSAVGTYPTQDTTGRWS